MGENASPSLRLHPFSPPNDVFLFINVPWERNEKEQNRFPPPSLLLLHLPLSFAAQLLSLSLHVYDVMNATRLIKWGVRGSVSLTPYLVLPKDGEDVVPCHLCFISFLSLSQSLPSPNMSTCEKS